MKKFIALLLIFSALTLSACSSTPEETETESESIETTPAVSETEETKEAHSKPENSEYVEYQTVHLDKDPVYTAEDKTMVLTFVDYEVWYDAESSCGVAYVSDMGAATIPASPIMDYPGFLQEDGTYSGVALQMEEALPSGDYEIYVTFAGYTCTFEMTVQ